MSVARPNRRAWAARGARVGTAATTLAVLAACADRASVTEPASPARSAATTGAAATGDVVSRVRLNITKGGHITGGGYILSNVLLGDTLYAVAFDTTGTVAWYRAFPGAKGGGDAYLQPNGNLSIFLGTSNGGQAAPGKFTEFRVSGAAVRDWSAPAGYYNDTHELLIGTGSRPSYLFGYDFHREDLRFRGGKADSLIAWHTVFSLDASGNAKPVFVARDHFTSADWVNPETRVVDYDHPNSIDVDPVDRNILVSWRNFDQVTKINPATGQFVWRLGGKNGQFKFVNDPFNGFSGQHFARRLANGNVLLFDNGNTHTPKVSRAVEYKIDTVAHTATLVWQFRHTPDIDATFVGSAQRLGNGNTVVGFSYIGLVTEVTPSGSVVWEAKMQVDGKTDGLVYRLLKVASLGHLRP